LFTPLFTSLFTYLSPFNPDIASSKQKEQIVKSWSEFTENAEISPEDSDDVALDKKLLAIRESLEAENGNEAINFHVAPWKSQWSKTKYAVVANLRQQGLRSVTGLCTTQTRLASHRYLGYHLIRRDATGVASLPCPRWLDVHVMWE